MSFLSKAQSGSKRGPQIYVIYGHEKVGKSTFASTFPKTLFIDIESGTESLNVTRLTSYDVATFDDLLKTLRELKAEKHDFKTIVIDSLTALESYMAKHICGGKYNDISEKPYGQGYAELQELTSTFMNTLIDLKKSIGVDIILIGHSKVKSFTDPYDATSYDRIVLQLNDKMAEKIKSYADNIFMLKREVYTAKGENGKVRPVGEGEIVLYTQWRPAADCGNRLGLPYRIVNPSHKTLIKEIEDARELTSDELKSEIESLLIGVDPETAKKARDRIAQAKTIEDLKFIREKVTEVAQAQA